MRCFNWVVAALVACINAPLAERATAAPVPTDPNLVLWMRADQGVTGTSPVTKIDDSSDNDIDMIGAGNPLHTTAMFPTGQRDVIRFGGGAAFYVPNTTALNLQNASIYMVATQLNGFFTTQCYVSNYGPAFVGYATGISDTQQNTIKFYTSHGTFQSSLEPFTVPDETPFLLTTTWDSLGNKNAYLDGGPAFYEAGAYPTYAANNQFVIGGLDTSGTGGIPGGDDIHQKVIGDIAEILIYNNVSSAQRADVEAYLTQKYFQASSHPGDFDTDGDVDGADFVAWQTHFPTASGATLADGDADNDGDVDGADFVVWQTNFPFTPGGGAAPVPEPVSILPFALGGIFALTNRTSRRRQVSRPNT